MEWEFSYWGISYRDLHVQKNRYTDWPGSYEYSSINGLGHPDGVILSPSEVMACSGSPGEYVTLRYHRIHHHEPCQPPMTSNVASMVDLSALCLFKLDNHNGATGTSSYAESLTVRLDTTDPKLGTVPPFRARTPRPYTLVDMINKYLLTALS